MSSLVIWIIAILVIAAGVFFGTRYFINLKLGLPKTESEYKEKETNIIEVSVGQDYIWGSGNILRFDTPSTAVFKIPFPQHFFKNKLNVFNFMEKGGDPENSDHGLREVVYSIDLTDSSAKTYPKVYLGISDDLIFIPRVVARRIKDENPDIKRVVLDFSEVDFRKGDFYESYLDGASITRFRKIKSTEEERIDIVENFFTEVGFITLDRCKGTISDVKLNGVYVEFVFE